jgi:hypothetical protein
MAYQNGPKKFAAYRAAMGRPALAVLPDVNSAWRGDRRVEPTMPPPRMLDTREELCAVLAEMRATKAALERSIRNLEDTIASMAP